MIKTNNVICFVDYNGETNLKKFSNKENHLEYKKICNLFDSQKNNLFGESFIFSSNKNYYNLFCLQHGKINFKKLEDSISTILNYSYLKHFEFKINTSNFIKKDKDKIIEIFKEYNIKIEFI